MAYVWEISTYTAICRTVISVGSYVPLMMLRGSQLGPQCIFFKTEKVVCLNASLSLLRGTQGTDGTSTCTRISKIGQELLEAACWEVSLRLVI